MAVGIGSDAEHQMQWNMCAICTGRSPLQSGTTDRSVFRPKTSQDWDYGATQGAANGASLQPCPWMRKPLLLSSGADKPGNDQFGKHGQGLAGPAFARAWTILGLTADSRWTMLYAVESSEKRCQLSASRRFQAMRVQQGLSNPEHSWRYICYSRPSQALHVWTLSICTGALEILSGHP